jgi:hypothetical protein
LLIKIEPGAGSVVESAGRDRKDLPFPCVLDILFLILVGADRPLDDIIAVILLRCGSLISSLSVLLDTKICFGGLLLLIKIEPGAGSVVESAGRDRKDLPFPCVLDILFLILVGADRPLDDIIAVILLRCGSLISSVSVLLDTKICFGGLGLLLSTRGWRHPGLHTHG